MCGPSIIILLMIEIGHLDQTEVENTWDWIIAQFSTLLAIFVGINNGLELSHSGNLTGRHILVFLHFERLSFVFLCCFRVFCHIDVSVGALTQ